MSAFQRGACRVRRPNQAQLVMLVEQQQSNAVDPQDILRGLHHAVEVLHHGAPVRAGSEVNGLQQRLQRRRQRLLIHCHVGPPLICLSYPCDSPHT
jgi:hypothetical protein